jgi:hypothetical protein
VSITIHDVASEERAAVQGALVSTAVPEIVEWLRRAATAPEGWKILQHRRSWRWSDGELTLGEDD